MTSKNAPASTMRPIELVLSKVGEYTKTANGYKCRCPAHDDSNPSLDIKETNDGAVLLDCKAGCDYPSIMRSWGLELKDGFPSMENMSWQPSSSPKPRKSVAPRNGGKKSKGYATAAEAASFFAGKMGPISRQFAYPDDAGEDSLIVLRWDRPDGKKDIRQISRDENNRWQLKTVDGLKPLYNLPAIRSSKGPVWVGEGELVTELLKSLGLVATTSAMGAGKAGLTDWSDLAGRVVYCLEDNDDAGREHMKTVAMILSTMERPAIPRLVTIPNLPPKGDVVDWAEAHDSVEPEILRQQLEEWSSQAKVWINGEWTEELRPVSLDQLTANNPTLSEPIIEGMLRRGEVANIVSASKIGKSWLVYGLAFSLSTGSRWLGHYQCNRSRVLLIDYELQCPTLADRLKKVSEALGTAEFHSKEQIDILSLRGRLKDLHAIKAMSEGWQGKYDVIVIDAWYRALPADTDENSNGEITQLYNLIDSIASEINCAWINIHHSSKGTQGGKSVVDVGSGAGAQSRAADTHMVLREHEDAGCAVLEAAVRSFAPVTPLPIRFDFPLWKADSDIDASAVKGRMSSAERRQREQDQNGKNQILESLQRDGKMTARKLRAATGLSRDRLERLTYQLSQEGRISEQDATVNGKPAKEYEIRDGVSSDWGEWSSGRPTSPPTLPLGG